jgi:hypothetical protein
MPHFHDYNPWAHKIIYVPSIAEVVGPLYEDYVFREYGQKVDAYILPQPSGIHCFGIRYGQEENEYLSPYAEPGLLQVLVAKYGARL